MGFFILRKEKSCWKGNHENFRYHYSHDIKILVRDPAQGYHAINFRGHSMKDWPSPYRCSDPNCQCNDTRQEDTTEEDMAELKGDIEREED